MPATHRIEFDEPNDEHMGADSNDIGDTVRRVAGEAEVRIREQMQERPYVVLTAAFGAGYVLGGGVPVFAARIMAAIGLRFAANEVVRQLVQSSQASHD
jgi:hypothetical protein